MANLKNIFFLPFEFKVALRYLLPKRKNAFASIISIISFLGIVIGVWALIVVMSVMNGFRTELLNRILGVNGHIIVQSLDNFDNNSYKNYIKEINKLPGVISSNAVVEGQILVNSRSGYTGGALVKGMEINDLKKLTAVSSNILYGNLADLSKPNNIAIGLGLAKQLGVGIGDQISLISPKGDFTPFGMTPRQKSYRIAAIYQVGMSEFDSLFIFMPLKEAQLFFNYKNNISSIEVFVDSPDNVNAYLKSIQDITKRKELLFDWRDRNQTFFSALEIERNVMFIILSLIILVAALNIISSLVMLVKDKGADIAILRTMGATRTSILRIFLLVGLTIGVVGTFCGVILAIVTCLNIEYLQQFISWLFNVDIFNSNLYFLDKLPAVLNWKEVLFVIIMSISLSFLATIFPARKASKLDPVKALRYE
ncbi:lipoprotein-releasing ABC transporter permease subunit [Bartonella sp. DGB1]|uniref:lipoprotein-releasing ABC transporter permease subunit n=1 Tax=Bartonella sp. DGB1 TaxID=3239807 RepID=UPI00352590B3